MDYESGREVVLTVDILVITVGFILSQEGEVGKCYPNHFGSISLTSVESWYSQAKLKLYGLFRSLRAVRVFIFGVTNLVVEMDTKYVKGMINNPDLQLNATINQWIASILLFHFKLRHISTDQHTSPDGLLHWPPLDDDPPDTDDFKDWLDSSYSFCITLLNDWLLPSSITPCSAHWGVVSLAYCPPSPRSRVASSFYPFPCQSLCSHILLSFTHPLPNLSSSRTLPLYLGLPRLSLEKPGFT